MDELLKALAEAIRQGTALAMPALIGYYVVEVVTTLIPAVTVILIVRMIVEGILRGQVSRIEQLTQEIQTLRKGPTA